MYHQVMRKGILDAIYWRLHSAFLRNERAIATKMLAILSDEMGMYGEHLKAEIGEAHFARFLRIQEKMANGDFGRLHGPGAEATQEVQVAATVDQAELDFCKELFRKRDILCEAIGCRRSATIVCEHDMGEYGRCDFYVRDGRTVKILEAKMGMASHALVSQIDKYRIAAELDMCVGTHDSVETYVLAGGYPKYVLDELARASVVVLAHDGKAESIRRIV